MPCTVCQHTKRLNIEQALMTGSTTLTALSEQYNLSTSALQRHKAHFQTKVNRAKETLQNNLRQGCLFWLSQALEIAMQTAQAAQAEGNAKMVLQAIQQDTRLITIILKQDLHLDDRVMYKILTSPQWATQSGLLPHDPAILAIGRQSLAEILSSPCSDSEDAPPTSPEDLDALQELFTSLAQPPDTSLKTANLPLKREKGGKLAGKTPFKENNYKEYQQYALWQKISEIMDFSPLAGPLTLPNRKLQTQCQIPGVGQ